MEPEKILVVSDLHYRLPQFDWLTTQTDSFDLIILAGDMLQLKSTVDPDTQAAVVEEYFRKICGKVPLIVCSGNHDIIDDGTGGRSAEWLTDLDIPNLTVDWKTYRAGTLHILSLPWWESEEEKARVSKWIRQYTKPTGDTVIWVNHAPAYGTKTGWNRKVDNGDPALRQWIEDHQPEMVLSGHVHNAPYYPEGDWKDRIGQTLVLNGGMTTGEIPATMVYYRPANSLTWTGMEGTEVISAGNAS